MRLVSMFIFLSIVSIGWVHASESKAEQRQAQPKKAARGTQTNPVFVEVLPREPTEKEAAKEKRHEENETMLAVETGRLASKTETLVYVTGALAAFTAFLFAVTACLARDSNKNTKALIAFERAYVFSGVRLGGLQPFDPKAQATVEFWNYGKTPAVVTALRAIFHAHPIGTIPVSVVDDDFKPLPPGMGIVPGGIRAHPEQVYCDMNPNLHGEIMAKKKRLYVYGLMEYKDVAGTKHETGFCWHLPDPAQSGTFEITAESPLNRQT